ncbi:hypothetical protein BH23ACT8_BH23ACT8_25630 [soil metagenome]
MEQVSVRGRTLKVPTLEETLRIKAWFVVNRNYARDYVDVAALADRLGSDQAGQVLGQIDEYYRDINRKPEAVSTQVARQLFDPRPIQTPEGKDVAAHNELVDRWRDWSDVKEALAEVAEAMLVSRTLEEEP